MHRLCIIIIVLLILAHGLRANSPMCEVYNYDTDKCELLSEQNLTVNPKWDTIVGDNK